MDLTKQPNAPFLYSSFNQDHSCLAIGDAQGYRIYNVDPFGKCYSLNQGAIGIVEMLFSTSLVAIVGYESSSPRKLILVNTKVRLATSQLPGTLGFEIHVCPTCQVLANLEKQRQSTICQLSFSSNITMVKLNRKRLVVLADQLYIYDISNLKLLHSIDAISSHLFTLSPGQESLIAYTNHSNSVLLFDSIKLEHLGVMSPHQSGISLMTFNHSGTLLATASDRGTVIRVSSVPSGEVLHQFRRGSYPAKISSLEFDLTSSVLAVGSDSDTIHVFRLAAPSVAKPKSLLASVTSAAAPLLPSSLSSMWDPERDWCRAKIPKGSACLVAPTTNQLLVVTDQGYFYQFAMDLEKGGELPLTKTFSYVPSLLTLWLAAATRSRFSPAFGGTLTHHRLLDIEEYQSP